MPPFASLRGAQVAKSGSLLTGRCFSLTGLAESDAGTSSREEAKTTRETLHGKTVAWEEKFLAALRVYKEMNRDTLVPYSFIASSGDARWPREMWGYALGNAVSVVRAGARKQELSSQMETELEKMDFISNVLQFRWDEIVMPGSPSIIQNDC
ncbi:hypothetical protein PHYSODRAFT_259525 [Phytophthora sojae]|uniref:Helicase-associated domain-containing protein n=1 Tax=Phytophthora sojae (strain P6497) TaxID=1094619 RepID=G4Z374_PHYSP|nr:hypothetical protein PHYSODRAFT_259525 [Phytophthora sojae]EGZ20743.1 hypothetical protein PHYSODRAFT_259525 [Phytophthora sojae]|eukprot:XP_009523460.1 hypothetical protein PHYSODRAFT_259525 [Phytophthora sojae]